MNKQPLPYDTSVEDVLVKIHETFKNPNVGKITQVQLKDGPRIHRLATLMEILDPETKALHHYSLRLDTIDRTKAKGWFSKPVASIRLEGGEHDEIATLYKFLKVALEGQLSTLSGDVHIIGTEQYNQLQRFLEELPKLPSVDKLEIVKTLLGQLDGSPGEINEYVSVFKNGNPLALKNIAAAARMVEYKNAFEVLQKYVAECCSSEQTIQDHLRANPWMFGSEYSELIPRRTWTRDDQVDYMLRRTVDGYLEIVEIKTPFKEPLFIYDKSHDSYYPSAKLTPVLGQVIRYVEEVDRNRDSIIAKDNFDTLKIRARIIVGRDGDTEERKALRNFNHHIHGIEVITFDQLVRIANRVLEVFEVKNIGPITPKDDHKLPF
jgi:Domain of unknown function (DUF4263)